MPDTQHIMDTQAAGEAPALAVSGNGPAGFPPVQPVNLWKAWKAFQGLVRDKEDTRYVFAFFEAVNGRSYERFYTRFANSDYGRRVIGDPKHIGRILLDRATLESHGPGTFAAAYLHYLDSENLHPEGVYQANWDNAPGRMTKLRDEWPHLYAMSYMMNLSHDLYHVLTGYGRDPLGEALLLLFSGIQTGGRGPCWLGRLAGLRIRQEIPSWPVGRMMAEAKRLAREAVHFPTTDLPALLELPLDEARAAVRVGQPQLYLETLASWDGEMPVAVQG
jgi:ubiquinone biosynthesis protein COQ4